MEEATGVVEDALGRGRGLFEQRAWQECWSALTAADEQSPLAVDDLRLLSISAYLAGHEESSADALARAYRLALETDDVSLAAQVSFWLAFMLLNTGAVARGSGWATRSRQLVEEHGLHGVEPALLKVMDAHQLIETERTAEGLSLAREALRDSEGIDDPDLRPLATLTVAQALMRLGRGREALDYMDDVIVAIAVDDVNPIITGLAYCAATATCLSLYELRRAREWATALSRWCDDQPGLVPYRGHCLVHRAQVMTLQGAWADALDETVQACERMPQPAVGVAYYQLGELHRLMGAFDQAEEAYRVANSWGRRPEPGLVRLRLAQGRPDVAEHTIRRLYAEEHDGPTRAEILVVTVEVMLEVGDVETAQAACAELTEMAEGLDSPMLRATSGQCSGSVALAVGDPERALGLLRRAWRAWQDLDLPYDAARTRILIARGLRALGDEDSAQMELDAARTALDRIGAAPDVHRVDLLAGNPVTDQGSLTPREVEVVRLVARGHTNRAVANELFLSEKTVARHLSNVYAKLGISSRAAATAYAYDHGLV
jgi:DNA-binding CsgD family transcriptional regulator